MRTLTASLLVSVCFGCSEGTDSDAGPDSAPVETSDAADAEDARAETTAALVARAGQDRYAYVDEKVLFDGGESTGAALFQWDFGNGRTSGPPRDSPSATGRYDEPGQYAAVLTVTDREGNRKTDEVLVRVTLKPTFSPRQSSTVAVLPGTLRVAIVSPDSSELSVFEWTTGADLRLVDRVATAKSPRTVAPWGKWIAVACQKADVVDLFRSDDLATTKRVALPRASRPYGVVANGDSLFVTLQGTGEIAEIEIAGGEPRLARRIEALDDARGVALLPDGRIAVTRWRSPDGHGEIAFIDPRTEKRETVELAPDSRTKSEIVSGGVPSYVGQILVSPTGLRAAVPSLQANVLQGAFRTGRAIDFESTVRAVVSFLDLPDGTEADHSRLLLDNRGYSAAGIFSSRGDWLYLAAPGARSVDRLDVLTGQLTGSIADVGFAPSGVGLSEDDRFLFVDAWLSREIAVYDATSFGKSEPALARLSTTKNEPLSSVVLRGKRLFNDSHDTRIDKDDYIACAHCHLDGDGDRLVWDFTDRGEGLRNTISLLGKRGGDGPVHWSGNFDEIQDFENDIRGPFQGKGLLSDAAWKHGTRSQTLGDSKAGVSDDLDALAAYVESLDDEPPSPFRTNGGDLDASALRGKTLFDSAVLGCTTCHGGPRFTDSAFETPGVPRLHDVGTLGEGSGQRLGKKLEGIDTPTLLGVWRTGPYLHDGSAETLRDVVTARNVGDRHGATSQLSSAEIDDLVRYLESL